MLIYRVEIGGMQTWKLKHKRGGVFELVGGHRDEETRMNFKCTLQFEWIQFADVDDDESYIIFELYCFRARDTGKIWYYLLT